MKLSAIFLLVAFWIWSLYRLTTKYPNASAWWDGEGLPSAVICGIFLFALWISRFIV